LVTSLAMNYVHRGSYFPEPQAPLTGLSGANNAAPSAVSAAAVTPPAK